MNAPVPRSRLGPLPALIKIFETIIASGTITCSATSRVHRSCVASRTRRSVDLIEAHRNTTTRAMPVFSGRNSIFEVLIEYNNRL